MYTFSDLTMGQSILMYMSSAWNLLDLAEIGMTQCWLSAACIYPQEPFLFPMGSVALLLVWFKLLFFFRAFRRTGPLVRMILAITAECVECPPTKILRWLPH